MVNFKFEPRHFIPSSKLQLNEEAKFGEEYQLMFDRADIAQKKKLILKQMLDQQTSEIKKAKFKYTRKQNLE